LVERIASLEAERRLAQLQDDFIAAVSHDLNTPLGFIKGYTTTLLREDTDWDSQTSREFLMIIDDESDRLSELIDNLLDSSRLQTGTLRMDFHSIDMSALIEDILTRVRTRYNNLDILVHVDPVELKIKADPKRIAQVMDNLIGNAAKYAPQSTMIISIGAEGDRVHISVKDNGPGISEEHLEHLFERFYRVPERSAGVRGSGLGLFICDQIVRAHNGEITVDSKVGEGTTFNVYIPTDQVPPVSE
jgi:signal transduction histidine kinase